MNLESWVEESQRRGEEIVVIPKNKTTKEEVEVTTNPAFIASCAKPKAETK